MHTINVIINEHSHGNVNINEHRECVCRLIITLMVMVILSQNIHNIKHVEVDSFRGCIGLTLHVFAFVLLNCVICFHHLKLELLTQFPASNDEKYFYVRKLNIPKIE